MGAVWPISAFKGTAAPGCYHPRSCGRCSRAGVPCGWHYVGDLGHEACAGFDPFSKDAA